jgi:hypothetical protein
MPPYLSYPHVHRDGSCWGTNAPQNPRARQDVDQCRDCYQSFARQPASRPTGAAIAARVDLRRHRLCAELPKCHRRRTVSASPMCRSICLHLSKMKPDIPLSVPVAGRKDIGSAMDKPVSDGLRLHFSCYSRLRNPSFSAYNIVPVRPPRPSTKSVSVLDNPLVGWNRLFS